MLIVVGEVKDFEVVVLLTLVLLSRETLILVEAELLSHRVLHLLARRHRDGEASEADRRRCTVRTRRWTGRRGRRKGTETKLAPVGLDDLG